MTDGLDGLCFGHGGSGDGSGDGLAFQPAPGGEVKAKPPGPKTKGTAVAAPNPIIWKSRAI